MALYGNGPGNLNSGDAEVCETIHQAALDFSSSILQISDEMEHPTEGPATGGSLWNGGSSITHGVLDVDYIDDDWAGFVAAHEGIHAALDDVGHDDHDYWMTVCYPGQN